jgi:hypothetical protein
MVKDLHAWGGIFTKVSNSFEKMPFLNNECGIIVSQSMKTCSVIKKKEIFFSLYKSQLLSISRLMRMATVLKRWAHLLQVLFLHQNLTNIYILSPYFYGPQKISFTLDFLSKSQHVVSQEWQLIPNNKNPTETNSTISHDFSSRLDRDSGHNQTR